ncbi:MAG: aminotransferase class V-fold PLP-dependent enzyme, partial [Planctomycetota bacterium]
MPETIYLDSNATTKPAPEVVRAVGDALEVHWANPSSVHRPGQAARRVVELAREKLAGLLGVKAKEVVLTGSGTESIDLAIRGRLDASGRRVIVTDDAEHAAVRDLAEALERTGIEVRRLPLLAGGLVDHAALSDLLAPGDVAVVSVQWANNETGVIQPVERVHETCREHGVAFHCDATQWVGKMPIAGGPPCDLLTCSAHKLHGPKGVGALWIRRGTRLRPVLHGAQELGRRAGTENVPGIAGAGEAARLASEWLERPEQIESGRALRDRFESLVLAAAGDAVVNGREHARLWNTSN